MSQKTAINPQGDTQSTVINSEIEQKTAINTALLGDMTKLPAGTILAEKYTIAKPLSIATGEADLYICQCAGQQYVAKIYRRQRAVKPEVVSALKAIRSPYVAPLFATGTYHDLPFEILPYYKNGSLQGKTFDFETLKSTVIPCINEALKVLHDNGMIHKDLKPSNIMLLDDGKNVALIDFGISSVVSDGNTVLVTKTGMTPEYSAPETFRNLFLEESDYYSLGITLYELYCGHTPYKNMKAEEIERFTTIQKIPMPDNIPAELRDLISAVTYPDTTNRHDKKNPNRRWTYDEVKNWYNGKRQPLPGANDGIAEGITIRYTFMGNTYNNIPSLITAFAQNWDDGKKQLYRGLVSGYFKGIDPEIAGFCIDAEEEVGSGKNNDDIVFWRLLYKIHPDLQGFYWMGQSYESLSALGRNMLESLWAKSEKNYSYWDSILKNKLLSLYLQNTAVGNTVLASAVSALETSHALGNKSKRDMLMDYYTTAYLLSGFKVFYIDGKQMHSVAELTRYMADLLRSSYDNFEAFCHLMIDCNDVLDVQLEAWLIAIGKRRELEQWKTQLAQ